MSLMIGEEAHRKVIAGGIDVPEEKPSFPLPLNEVGISNKDIWILLPQGRLQFSANIMVDLPGDVRGIHMSRMEEAIADLYDREFADLREYGARLAEYIVRCQRGVSGRIILNGRIPRITTTAFSNKKSVNNVDIIAEVQINESEDKIDHKIIAGIGTYHITACPCTQAYNRELLGNIDRDFPLPTHSQRSYTRLFVESTTCRPTYEQLFLCLDRALHVTNDLLKRPDEAEMVLVAHKFPQFAEDAARETAKAVGTLLGKELVPGSRVTVETQSFESIHIHDVNCRLETSMSEIVATLGKTVSNSKKNDRLLKVPDSSGSK